MNLPVVLFLFCWADVSFASNGFRGSGGQRLSFQTLLADELEAVKEDRAEDRAWRAAEAKKEHVAEEKKHVGFQTLLKDAEEAEKEDLEADTKWEEEDPEADENWQRAHDLFEKLHARRPRPDGSGKQVEHDSLHDSHFARWAKHHPGFQHLLKDELETEREEIEAEHEEAVEEEDDRNFSQQSVAHEQELKVKQTKKHPNAGRHPGFQHMLKDDLETEHAEIQAEHKEALEKEDRKISQQSVAREQELKIKQNEKHPLGFQKLLEDEELKIKEEEEEEEEDEASQRSIHDQHSMSQETSEKENPDFQNLLNDEDHLVHELKHKDEALRKNQNDHVHRDHPGFQKLLKNEELNVQENEKHPEGFQKLLEDEELQVKAKKEEDKEKRDVPGFQTLLKGEEQWVQEREANKFLEHRSNKMSKSSYQPLDGMPDTGFGVHSDAVAKKPQFAKGSFWHSMAHRSASDRDIEDQDALNMAAEERDPRDLHDTSRNPAHHFTREISGVSGWGKLESEQDPNPDDDRELMDMIEQMRAEYCSKRPEGVMNHKDCSKWMFDKCRDETSGGGWCDKFKKDLTNYCAKHPEHKYCEGVKDTDGDGILDDIDVFPEDVAEWEDSDGDGVGNNADAFDDDPSKHEPEGGHPDQAPAPAPAPAIEGPAAPPAKAGDWPGSSNKKAEGATYPEQGYNEYYRGNMASHNDKETWVGDWQGEWPQMDETHDESIAKACLTMPKSDWCVRYWHREHPNYPEKEKGFTDWLLR
jgi:hypothetical protein